MLTKLVILPVLAILEVLDLLAAQRHWEFVQNRREGIHVLQHVPWIIQLWVCHGTVHMYAFAVV